MTKKIIIFAIVILTLCAPSTFLYCNELTPEEFVNNNLKKTRERLALLKEGYSKTYVGSELQGLDLKSVLAALPKHHTLKFFLKKKALIPDSYYGATIAANEPTSNFLGIPRDIPFAFKKALSERKIASISLDVLSLEGVSIDGNIYKVGSIKELPGYDLFEPKSSGYWNQPNLTSMGEVHLIIHSTEKIQTSESINVVKTYRKHERPDKWGIPVIYRIDEPGPFFIGSSGNIIPLDIGSVTVKMSIGNLFYFSRKITANRWDLELDPFAEMGGVLPFAPNKATFFIYGPADMNQYNIQWGGKNINWQKHDAGFINKGNYWVLENTFTVSDKANVGDFLTLGLTLINKNTGRAYPITKIITYTPKISSIGLELAAKGQGPTTEGIDLFFPNYQSDGNRFRVNLIFKDEKNKEIEPTVLKKILPIDAKLSFQSSSPNVVQIDEFGGQVNNIVGESLISAKMDLLGKTLLSPQINVTANKLLLTKENTHSGFTYTIRVIGPADMKKYQAVFHHAGGSHKAIFIKGDEGSQSAGISTIDPIDKVEIQKDGMVVASIPINDTTALPAPSIKLLPIKLPGKVVDTITPVDLGSLTTTAECRKTLRKQFPEYYGTASDDVLNSICSDMREREKQEIKEQREIDKAQMEILKSLKKEGRQLVVFSDATEIAAVISGSFDPKRMYCRWRIEQGGSLKMENTQTDITSVGRDGACYNKIVGFQGDFNTNAIATVELVYSYAPVPLGQFTPGGQTVIEGRIVVGRLDNYTDKKGLMEWIRK